MDRQVKVTAGVVAPPMEQAGFAINMAEVGQAWLNGYAERLMRTIKVGGAVERGS